MPEHRSTERTDAGGRREHPDSPVATERQAPGLDGARGIRPGDLSLVLRAQEHAPPGAQFGQSIARRALALQRTHGNAYVQRLMRTSPGRDGGGAVATPARRAVPEIAHETRTSEGDAPALARIDRVPRRDGDRDGGGSGSATEAPPDERQAEQERQEQQAGTEEVAAKQTEPAEPDKSSGGPPGGGGGGAGEGGGGGSPSGAEGGAGGGSGEGGPSDMGGSAPPSAAEALGASAGGEGGAGGGTGEGGSSDPGGSAPPSAADALGASAGGEGGGEGGAGAGGGEGGTPGGAGTAGGGGVSGGEGAGAGGAGGGAAAGGLGGGAGAAGGGAGGGEAGGLGAAAGGAGGGATGGLGAAAGGAGGGAAGGGAGAAAGGAAGGAGAARAPRTPEEDPAFQAVADKSKQTAQQQKRHPSGASEAGKAQAAAVGPPNEVSSKASEEQVDEISEQEAPAFDRAAFKAALMARIAQTAPSSLEQADNFKGNNNLSAMKSELSGKVKEGKEQSQGPIEEKAKEAPDTSGVEPKPVTPLAEQKPGPAPAKLGAAAAAPKPRTAAEVENPIRESSQSIDQEMTEGGVTEEQLAQSNEPEFESALGSKREAQEHAAQAPGAFRGQEQEQLQGAQAQAEEAAGAKTSAMHGQRATILQQVAGSQTSTKTQDEQKRAEVASRIESIYEKTRSEVEARLATLDQEAAQAFEGGAADAKQRFESYVERRMNAYKARRYDGITGAALWLTDKVFGMPSAVNAFYTQGRDLYIAQMDRVIDRVVDVVATGLSDAKQRVAQGRQEIKSYVASLPQALREVGQNAAGDIQAKFDALNQTVSDKQEELVTELANRYNESVQAVDAQIESMKAENQGLVDKAIGAVRAVIQKIVQLKDMLFGVLKKAASVVDRIVTAPIEFLGNLVSGVKRGLDSFVSNIGKHLKSGLIGWLTGAISSAGIVVPENLDLKGIFSLVTQVLGLTWTNIRQKLVKRLGEKVVAGLEKTYDVLKMLITKGPIALWELVKDKIGDLKAMVMDKIEDFLITKVIKAGITWIIGLLNPAAALIKAVKAIYDIIMFFVNRGSQIMSLVNAILDSVISIAKGNLSGAAKLVENALAKAVPVAIGFLASLLGLGGISEKVRDIMKAVRRPIDKAIGFVIDKVVKAGKKLARTGVFGKAKSAYGKAKAGVKKVKEKAKEVYSDARAKAKAAAGKATDRLGGKKKPPEGKERSALMSDVRKAVSAVTNQPFKKDADAKAALGGVLKVFQPKGLQALDAKPKPKAAGAFDVIARNPTKSDVGDVRTEEDDAKAVAAKEAVSRALGSDFPALVKILHALIDDREHPLSLVRDLKDSTMRPRVIALIREMAERRALGDKPFEEFMRDHPGAGPLYEKVKPGLNYDESGASKKEAFVEEAKESDPARAAGAELSDKEEKLVREYQRKLISKVEAKVRSEVEALARSIETKLGGRATVSIRTKTAEGLIDKVRRMVSGAKGRRVRLDYQVGDVIDAVGARITVDNTEALEKLLAETKERYADDILEVENMYATPKAHARAYRVIPFVIKTEIDGEWFTFELQLNTLRASIAADLEHNTVFKPLIEVTEDQKQMVKAMMAEAAVLDQLETREAST